MRIVNLAILAFASCILAKNIVYLDDLVAAVKNDKREAKNIVSLDDLNSPVKHEKREAKNIVTLDALKEAAEEAVYNDENTRDLPKRELQRVFQPTAPSLQSLLPQVKSISVISGYLRNDENVVNQLENSNSFVLIVAPSDEAFSRLAAETGKKPWEYPQEIENNENDEQIIKNNLSSLVRAHVSEPIDRQLSEKRTVTLLSGNEIAIEHLAGSDIYEIAVGGKSIPVISIHQAENGVVFVVDTVLS